ncbi:hypothetical protein RJ639_008897 [Escallonia herrerae]|uniref:Uncharacterized protein n=1 Tax=Escallonia herrerae TaxID=1293975 RepID=A0AA88VPL6_9ASTE|nr:hypothetical protein RJ639_008897 [Escallonia herrerae]
MVSMRGKWNHSQHSSELLEDQKNAQSVWAEAVDCAVYLLKRCPYSSVQGEIPQEAWHGRKPSVSHLRIFGNTAYMHIPDEKRSKLDEKSEKYVFIGYDLSGVAGKRGKGARLHGDSMPLDVYNDFYYLSFEGISVGNKRLDIDPKTFERTQTGYGGVIIDSGAMWSFLFSLLEEMLMY